MPLYSGLLISCHKGHENSTASEAHFVLTNELDIDHSKIRVRDTRVSGLVTVGLDESLDYDGIVRQLMKLEEDTPYFMHCLKIRPVHHVMEDNMDEVVAFMELQDISFEGSFRITVNKRHSSLSSMDVISPVAELFLDNEVDLEEPDWEILFEIIADRLGYAVIRPELVFSTQIAYEDQMEEEVENWFLE